MSPIIGNNSDGVKLSKAGISHWWATEIYITANPDPCLVCARYFEGWTGKDCRDMIGKVGSRQNGQVVSGKCFRPIGTALVYDEVQE
jgi:hypothetical protein